MKILKLMLCFVFITSSITVYALDVAEAKSNKLSDWNLAFGIGAENYNETYVDTASIQGENRIVTVDKTYEILPSAWLTLNAPLYSGATWGPYIGVKLIDSNAEAFSAISIGLQKSFVIGDKVENLRKLSLGAGWVTHGTKTLASGIKEGESLPDQYDEIKYRESTESSWMIMLTVGI